MERNDGAAGTERMSQSVSHSRRFNSKMDDLDGGPVHDVSYVQVDRTRTQEGASWPSASDVRTANPSGYFVACHVFVEDVSNQPGTVLPTGFATNDQLTAVPASPSVALLGIGLAVPLPVGRTWKKLEKN
jgi:hypothetical protein